MIIGYKNNRKPLSTRGETQDMEGIKAMMLDKRKDKKTRNHMQTHNQQVNNIKLHRNKRKTHIRNPKKTARYRPNQPRHIRSNRRNHDITKN